MSPQEIIEYNKKCAEFLEAECILKSKDSIYQFNFEIDVKESYDEGGYNGTFGETCWCLSEMKFNSDWNWIHEVIEKINQSKITAPMNGIPDSIMPYIELRRPIIKGLINNNKEEVIQAINQFLIWYEDEKI